MFFVKESSKKPAEKDNNNIIYKQAARNNPAGVMVCLMKGISINYEHTGCGGTALFAAVYTRNEKLVRMLLSEGANPRIANKEGVSPLKHSKIDITYNSNNKAIAAIHNMLSDQIRGKKITPHFEDILLYAGIGYYEKVKEWIIEKKFFDINKKEGSILSYLLLSPIGNNVSVLKDWQGCGANLNINPNYLIYAVREGNADAVDYLLEKGIDPDVKDGMALEIAYEKRNIDRGEDVLKNLLIRDAKGSIYFQVIDKNSTAQEDSLILEELEDEEVECTRFLINRALAFVASGSDANQRLQAMKAKLKDHQDTRTYQPIMDKDG